MNGNGGKAGGKPRGGGKNRNRGNRSSVRGEGGDYRNGAQNGDRNGGRNDRNDRNGLNGRNDHYELRRGEGENNKKSPTNNRGQIPSYQRPRAISYRDKRVPGFYDGPKWAPAKKPDEPIPEIVCSLCGKPIADLASAISDREGDAVFHFDCIAAKLKERETLEAGDSLTYIGGGRFGVVHHDSPRKFTIKKIIEWDLREERVPWRKLVADYYSST
jgi:hypothetical protein